MNIVIINQARMTSTRLPGKVMKEVMGRPLLGYQIERLKRVSGASSIVIATTVNREDDVIASYAESLGVPVFRGSEEDVLGRYHGAATRYGAEAVVRVTSDCPLVDPGVLDRIIDVYLRRNGSIDFVSTGLKPSFPNGIGGAIFSMAALEAAHREAVDPAEREHVTAFIYWRPERFRLEPFVQPDDCSAYRLTVDTVEDFELVRRILETLYPQNPVFSWQDAVDLLKRHPDWMALNAHVVQKKISPEEVGK